MSDQGPRRVVVPCSNLQKQITCLMSRSNIDSPLRYQVENFQKTLYSMEPMVYDMEQSVLVQNSPRHAFTDKFLPLVKEAKIAIGNLLQLPDAKVNNPSFPYARNLGKIREKLKTLFGEYVEAELRVLSSSIEEAGEQDEMVLQRLVIYLRSNIRNQLPHNTSKPILRNIAIILGSLKQESDKRVELLLLLNEVKLLLRFLNGDHGLDMPNLLLIREQELRKQFVTKGVMAQLKELDHQDKELQRRENKCEWIVFLLFAASFLFVFSYPPQSPSSYIIITVAVCVAGYALFELIWDNSSTATGTPHKSDDGNETSSNYTNSNGRKIYEIFLNFRGSDVRYTVAGLLHDNLEKANICTFFDERSARKSERFLKEIKMAIGTSIGAICIFSENYGESEYCLDELVDILERENTHEGYKIRPIFYDVIPDDLTKSDDLTKPESTFRLGLRKHGNAEEGKLKKWEDALTNVILIGGDVHDSKRDHLNELVNKVVDDFKNHVRR